MANPWLTLGINLCRGLPECASCICRAEAACQGMARRWFTPATIGNALWPLLGIRFCLPRRAAAGLRRRSASPVDQYT